MFINNVTSPNRRSATKKLKKLGNSSAAFADIIESSDTSTADGLSSATEVHNITMNSLLTLQDVGSSINLEKKNYEKGESLLRNLDKYKQSVLISGGDQELLESLVAQANQVREFSDNQDLEQVIDEIELLAAVEAAKKGKI